MFPTLKPTSATLMVFALLSISSLEVVKAVPTPGALWAPSRRVELEARDCSNPTLKKNALDAQNLNKAFKEMTVTDPCQDGQTACIQSHFAQCTSSKWTQTPCPLGSCFAIPNDSGPGTSLMCGLPRDIEEKFKSACMEGGPEVNFVARDGEDQEPEDDCNEQELDDGPSKRDEDPVDDDVDEARDYDGGVPPSSKPPSPNSVTLMMFTTTPSPTESKSNNLNDNLTGFDVERRQLHSLTQGSFKSPLPAFTPTPTPTPASTPPPLYTTISFATDEI